MNLDVAADYPKILGYLNTATFGIPPTAATEALVTSARAWGDATFDPLATDGSVARVRAAYARIVGSHARDVTLGGSVSQVVGMVAASLPDGAHVLAARGDFTSVLGPFLADPRLTVTLVDLERLIDDITPSVDLVAVSSAQSADGRIIDVDALAHAANRAGAKTLIDVSQSAGWLPIDSTRFDVVVAGGYKWLSTPRGVALAAVRPDNRWIRPVLASWYGSDSPWDSLYGPRLRLSEDARRLDTSPPWQIMEAAAVSLETLARHSIEDVNAHSVGLANDLRVGLGLAESNSAIVSVANVDTGALEAAGIKAATRDGRARLGFYLYNDMDDVELALRALSGARVHVA